jgi:23S rRNA pseudouridine955/2504/2580 synthase
MPDRHACAASARLNSKKSSTYGVGVEHRIIEGKGRGADLSTRAAAAVSAAPATRHVRIEEDSAGQRLDNFLVKLLKGVPKTHVYRVIRSGEVRVNKGRAGADTRLALGDEVRVPPVRTASPASATDAPVPAREFPVVYEDESLLAVDKPAGVAVHGGSGVSFGVIEQLRRARPEARFLELVHRLDKDTSGLLLLAKKRSALLALQEQLRERGAERSMAKSYAALVVGRWPARLKVIDVALHKYIDAAGERRVRSVDDENADGRRSITLVRIVQAYEDWTLLDVTLKTGRTHQIRVHLADAGHPIAGDDKYGDRDLKRALARGTAVPGCRFERMFLHASRLRFAHPATAEPLVLEAPLPDACTRLLDALGANIGTSGGAAQ